MTHQPKSATCHAVLTKLLENEGGRVKKTINVVGAVIVNEGAVLCAQRGPGALAGMWEFPGGKIEPGESARDALAREIDEELQCEVKVGDEVVTTTHEYDFGIVNLTTFYCDLLDGEPQLTEHAEVRWEAPDQLHLLEWAPADIPAVVRIQADFAS
jgi:8-oxo-dGTP diphosphatase